MAGIAPISSGGYHPLLQTEALHSKKLDDKDSLEESDFEKQLGTSPTKADYEKKFHEAFNDSIFQHNQHSLQVYKQQMDEVFAEEMTPPKNNKHRG